MQIKENHIIVNRTARYYTFGQLNEQTKHVLFVVHGYRQMAENFLKDFEPIVSNNIFIIAPEAMNRFYTNDQTGKVGATWMTKADRLNEIKDYINYLDDLYENFELSKFNGTITVLGFSQGASTITRWINTTQNHIDNVIVYAGEVAPELLPLHTNSGLKRTKNYYICGTNDEFFTPELRNKVAHLYTELNFTEIEFDGGHVLNTAVLKTLLPQLAHHPA